MRKVAIATLAALSLGTLTQTASAEGFYVGAGLGQTTVKADGFKDDDIGFKIFGGYAFNQNFAAEIEYLDGGTAKDDGIKAEASYFAASVVGSIPLGNAFSLFARLGFAAWDLDTNVGDDDGEDLLYGIGAAFNVTEQLQVRLEWEAIDVDGGDADTIGVNALFKF
jgi:OOP family OmpA-OmpF porin